MRRVIGWVCVLGLGIGGLVGGPAAAAELPEPPGLAAAEARADAHGSTDVLLGLSTPHGLAAAQTDVLAALRGTGARITQRFRRLPAIAVQLTPAAADALQTTPGITRVVRDISLTPALTTSTELIGAKKATLNGNDGRDRVIAVLDTGVDNDHPFLAGKVISGAEACFASDCSLTYGPDAADNCASATSTCMHGTHVAGIAAGLHTAAMPYDGVAPGADILAVRVLPVNGSDGSLSSVLAGLEYVYSLRSNYDIAAVNLSLGTSSVYTGDNCDLFDGGYLQSIVGDLRAAGIATVVAAGNNGNTALNIGSDTGISYPGCISNVVAVGNSSKTTPEVTANSGNSSSAMELWAPGIGVLSSVPVSAAAPNGSASMTGTSMATPHVAGAFAVLDQHFPAWTVDQKLDYLMTHGPTLTRNGVTRHRVDLHGIDAPPPPLSNAPTDVVATAGDGFATVTWQAPTGATVASYVVTAAPGGSKVVTTATTVKVTGLKNGVTYVFTVEAVGAALLGETQATSNPVTPVSRIGGPDDAISEGDVARTKRLAIEMRNTSTKNVTVSFRTENGVTGGGLYGAQSGQDFVAQTGSVVIPAGTRRAYVNIVIVGDNVREPKEHMIVRLIGASGATIEDSVIRLTIKNDD